MASIVKIKRSSIKGKAPSLSSLQIGELALNVRDGKLFSANSSAIFEIGSNVSSISTSSLHFPNTGIISSNSDLTVLLDSDNGDSSANFIIKKNTSTKLGGTELFKVEENGQVTFNDTYTFPNSDGSSGQALVTDGSGGLAFSSVASSDELDDILARNS